MTSIRPLTLAMIPMAIAFAAMLLTGCGPAQEGGPKAYDVALESNGDPFPD